MRLEGQRIVHAGEGRRSSTSLEIALELPDKFVRIDSLVTFGGGTAARVRGFNGQQAINRVAGVTDGGAPTVMRRQGRRTSVEPQPSSSDALAASERREFARLALGLLGRGDTRRMTLASVETASGGRRAHVITIDEGRGPQARWFVDAVSRLPLMLRWSGPDQRPGASSDAVEHTLYYQEYRTFGEVTVPVRIRKAIDGVITEELVFDVVEVNVPLDPGLFAGGDR
jgi:hypothetical protein